MRPKQEKPASVMELMIEDLQKHPGYRPPPPDPPRATETMFKEVLQAWNLCPSDWAADMRVSVLGCSQNRFADEYRFYSDQREQLTRQPDPLIETPSAEFLKAWTHAFGKGHRAALNHVAWWHDFTRNNYPAVTGYKLHHVKRWLCFQDDNLPDSDNDVATFRTGRELVAQKKFKGVSLAEFWKLKEPPLALVEHAQERWREYRDARKKARQHFRKLDLPGKLSDYATPADALWHVGQGFWDSAEARKLADQLTDAEKEIVHNPAKMLEYLGGNFQTSQDIVGVFKRTHRTTPEFLSSWGFMFRCACGLVSEDEFRLTLPTFFLKLSLDEKLKFLKFTHAKPRRMNKNRRALLATWLQDNAPIFSECRWHTEAVLDAAAHKFNDHDKKWIPKSPESLTQFCSRGTPKIKLGLHKARCVNEADKFAQPHKSILTDPPVVIR